MSSTVTVASQVAMFPLSSVIVKVTVLSPTFEQSNEFGETSNVYPQLSEDPPPTSAPVIEASPLASS